MPIQNKIDFAIVIRVEHANPNGDPLNANRPRQTVDRIGEITDVCLKRKIRNRLLAMNKSIFVQSDENRNDDCRSLNDRYEKASLTGDLRTAACKEWYDVRAFGQVFAFKNKKKTKKQSKDDALDETADAVSYGIRGPVTIQSAFSLEPILTESIQITKSVNLETNTKNPDKKTADTMGMKHRVAEAVYVAYGAISPQLAEKTGFSDEDAEAFKSALQSLFVGDASTARPEGSMEVLKVIWCKHNSPCGQYSSAQVHRAIKNAIATDGCIDENRIKSDVPNLEITFLNETVN